MTRFVFVTGGVVSSLGKGIAAASLGAILEARGLKVAMVKLDPYINVDPGTMSPFQHGEVFVTQDGTETDLDLGHYERFVRTTLLRKERDAVVAFGCLGADAEYALVVEEVALAVVPIDEPVALLMVELRDGSAKTAGGLGNSDRLQPRQVFVVDAVGDGLVLDRLSGGQVAVAVDVDRTLMNEHVRTAVVVRNEAVPLGLLPQLDDSCRHALLLFLDRESASRSRFRHHQRPCRPERGAPGESV
jgi:hypothetical protein